MDIDGVPATVRKCRCSQTSQRVVCHVVGNGEQSDSADCAYDMKLHGDLMQWSL